MVLSLETLSTELLLKIFKYLDIYDLCKLKQTCKRFNEVIERWAHHFHKNVRPLVTNQAETVIINHSARLLSPFERLRVCRNWRLGIYKEQMLLYSKIKYIPWLQLEKDLLWVSREGFIKAYLRTSKGINSKSERFVIKSKYNTDVCKFFVKEDSVISGQIDGSIYLWSKNKKKFIFYVENCHEADINSLDFHHDILVSGSRDNFCKIWKICKQKPNLIHAMDLQDRVWSTTLFEQSLLAIGTAGTTNYSIIILDIQSQNIVNKLDDGMSGAGILDIKWESPSILWTCGYDTHIRRWDLRLGDCVQSLVDPGGSAVYCFEYDHFNTIISGTQNNGRTVLWDIRKDDYIQMYYMECCQRGRTSPIYSLSFDPDSLYTVTDQYINILNFSIYSGKSRDYSNIFHKIIKA